MRDFKDPTALHEKSRGISPVLAVCRISDALITRIPADEEPFWGNAAVYAVIIIIMIMIMIIMKIMIMIIMKIIIWTCPSMVLIWIFPYNVSQSLMFVFVCV